MRRRTALGVAAILLALTAGGALTWLATDRRATDQLATEVARKPSGGPQRWTEAQWPFAIDQWGKGKAFRCKAADCGAEMVLYLRAKVGFCNCTTGVADDEELERISDLDLMGTGVTPIGDGRPIRVAWMTGRSRSYAASGPRPAKAGLSIGFNDRCDAIVATVVFDRASPEAAEADALTFLNSASVLRWAEVTLGL